MGVTDVFHESMNYAWKKRAGGKRVGEWKGFPLSTVRKQVIFKV